MRLLSLRCALVAVLALTSFVLADPASAAPAAPHVPAGLPSAIEPLADYVPQVACNPVTQPGTAALAALLAATYRGISYSTVYACGTDGTISEHYDGRAIDFMTNVRNPAQAADESSLLNWLLATDSHGNKAAMARRLGVMYLVANNRIWGAWDGQWHPYHNCANQPQAAYDNSCHRTHVHISLSWAGARKQTSFWTHRVAATDFGPCAPNDMNYAAGYGAPNPKRCPAHHVFPAPAHSSATRSALYAWSGVAMWSGSTGPAVAALQRGLHVPATGSFGTQTTAALKAFQVRHHQSVTGATTYDTWRVLRATAA